MGKLKEAISPLKSFARLNPIASGPVRNVVDGLSDQEAMVEAD